MLSQIEPVFKTSHEVSFVALIGNFICLNDILIVCFLHICKVVKTSVPLEGLGSGIGSKLENYSMVEGED
jgi:hypothetical protein